MNEVETPIDRVSRDTAHARLERLLYLSVGIAAVVYGILLTPGMAGISGQSPQLRPWYADALVIIAVLMPASLGALTWIIPRSGMRAFAGTTSMLFLVAMALFPTALIGDYLASDEVPWFQGIHALHAMIAAIVWQGRAVWLYAIAQGPIIGVVQHLVRPDSGRASMLDAVGSLEFAVILMGATLAVVGAADRQDRASERARAQAARGAATRTREREESRINAMVHDDIMSVLLTASRENPPPSLGDQAKVALNSIATLDRHDAAARLYTSQELIAAMSEEAYIAAPDATVISDVQDECFVPAEVVSAVADALGEALRNSVRHAGPPAAEIDRVIRVWTRKDSVVVSLSDNGKGFNPRAVTSRRLGIRLSIIDRMSLLDGGGADIRSRPGEGTTVTLRWQEPK